MGEITKSIDDLSAQYSATHGQNKRIEPMSGWIERKQEHLPHAWLKRYVVLHGRYLLWSDRQMEVSLDYLGVGGVDETERKRWNHTIDISKMQKVEEVQTKKGRRFRIKVKGHKKDYLFRAKDRKSRDQWVDSVRKSMQHW